MSWQEGNNARVAKAILRQIRRKKPKTKQQEVGSTFSAAVLTG